MNVTKKIQIPFRWMVHGTLFQRTEMILFPNKVNKRLNTEAENEFSKMDTSYGLNQKNRKTKIIVSLTTIPRRLDKIRLVVSRMMNQTIKPDAIILYIDENKENDFSFNDDLVFLTKKGLQIKYVRDIGPHTKYYYALQEFSKDIVITVDDDIIYSHKLIETLYNSYTEYPTSISANIAINFSVSKGRISPSINWIQKFSYGVGSDYTIAYGVGGVLYPPNVMPKETFDEKKIRDLTLYQDDLWLKMIEISHDIEVVKAKGGDKLFGYFVTVNESQEISLRSQNDFKDRNRILLTNLIECFSLERLLE